MNTKEYSYAILCLSGMILFGTYLKNLTPFMVLGDSLMVAASALTILFVSMSFIYVAFAGFQEKSAPLSPIESPHLALPKWFSVEVTSEVYNKSSNQLMFTAKTRYLVDALTSDEATAKALKKAEFNPDKSSSLWVIKGSAEPYAIVDLRDGAIIHFEMQ